jgi:hypothetical protein
MPKKIEQPPPLEPATSDDFAEALKDGDALTVAAVLRRLGGLSAADCELLADHFVSEPSPLFPLRLQFVRRGRGRPTGDLLQKLHDKTRVKEVFSRALAESGKYEAAVQETVEKTKLSRTIVTGVLAAQTAKITDSSNSPNFRT